MNGVARGLLLGLEGLVLVSVALVNVVYFVQLLLAGVQTRKHQRRGRMDSFWRVLGSSVAPRITILSTTRNEQVTICQSVRALLGLDYPNLRVVIVNEGSSDGTLEALLQAFDLRPSPRAAGHLKTARVRGIYSSARHHLIVVDKECGGNADAINAGLNHVQTEFVCVVGVDAMVEVDALQRMVRPFVLEEDGVLGVRGTIRVANGSRIAAGRVVEAAVPARMLARIQVVEYLRASFFQRAGGNGPGGSFFGAGALGLFRTADVVDVGGYAAETSDQRFDVVARLRRQARGDGRSSRVVFVAGPVAWTEVPASVATLREQRARWNRGLARGIWRHRDAIFEGRFELGRIGARAFMLIEMFAPAAEFIALSLIVVGLPLDLVGPSFAIAFALLAYGLAIIVSLTTILLEEVATHRYRRSGSRRRLLVAALIEQVGFRQMTSLWRFEGLIWAFRSHR